VLAVDPPHTFTNNCAACHITHNAPGADLGSVAGNANLCMSCHVSGGSASAKPFANANQAIPWPGLPSGTNAAGNSHRWDSGPSGRVQFIGGAAIASTGAIISGGTNTNYYAKTFTLTITNAGAVGTARFNWTATNPGGGAGTNVLTGSNVALNDGITVTFQGAAANSFQLNDKWNLYVRTDLRLPTDTAMLLRMTNNLFNCSTCHDEHSQTNAPFDPTAPVYAGAGTGAGRHFQRVNNNTEQMCQQCHINRNVTNSIAGSHPVGINLLTNAFYQGTTNLPLEKTTGLLRCETCHDLHFASASDGSLARMTNSTLCVQCHTLANTTTPAAHFNTSSGVLWPGGQYGSTLPTNTVASDRGSCVNCHQPHGWPDNLNPTNHFPLLMVERFDRFDDRTDPAGAENLCFTCHDADGPAVKKVQPDFAKRYHHPIADTEQTPGRSVECRDCHEVHQALANSHNYTNTATSARNLASNPLKGVSGVAVSYTGLTNFTMPMLNRYTSTNSAVYEYQICFKCHTAYDYAGYNTGNASFTSASVTITGTGTAWTTNLLGSWIIRSNDFTSYVITNVVSATSLQVKPAYTGTTTNGQGYLIWRNPPGLTAIYPTNTANFTNNSTLVRGNGTVWHAGFVGSWINLSNNPAAVYKIVAVANATNLTIFPAYAGTNVATQNYSISGGTDLAQEFSPYNASGHPVVTGLNSYSNSTTPKAMVAAQMKAPWNVNLGTQTMMCSDCHDATTTNYVASAAQGPHGSAVQYMLRGPNGANWPNVILSSGFATSWCANCHNNSAGEAHSRSDHSARRCYECHIVIPHGGKLSRLIADGNSLNMPARYAYNNNTNLVQVTGFTKKATGSYTKSDCGAKCATGDHPLANGAQW